jgi:hypothetical protein
MPLYSEDYVKKMSCPFIESNARCHNFKTQLMFDGDWKQYNFLLITNFHFKKKCFITKYYDQQIKPQKNPSKFNE